jgi:transcriptional regulator with XRE-family HTH domain
MATTPTVNRLQLGSLLRHFRQEAQLTQEQLGERVFPKASPRVRQARIAKTESGERILHDADLAAMLLFCKVTDPQLRALVDQLHTNASKRGRWSGYRAMYNEQFRKYVDLETDAAWIRECAQEVVPDLCETEAHVRALFGLQFEEGLLTGQEFPAAVQARLARQEILSTGREDGMPPVNYHVLMSESCVRRVVGNRAIMTEQLQHLVKMSQMPNVTIQLIPFGASVQGFTLIPYSMLRIPVLGVVGDLDFVCATIGNSPIYMDDKATVQWHEHNFQVIGASALRPDDSRALLREIEREYRYR